MLDSRLVHVVAVSRGGSFTAAAQDIGVTQSAITKSVADLERQVGFSIFHRTARGVILTEKGSDFVDRAARLLDDTRDLLLLSAQDRNPYAGVVRVGVCPGSLEWFLVNPVTELLNRYPGIKVDASSSSFERMVQQLRNGSVDVAIGFDEAFSEWPDFRREPLGSVKGVLFVRKSHPLLDQQTHDVAELSSYDFVSPSEIRPYGGIIRDLYLKQNVCPVEHVHVVDYFPLVKRIVASSDSIGIVSRHHADNTSFLERFALLEGFDIVPPVAICAATRARWDLRPVVKAFVSIFRASAARSQGIVLPGMIHASQE